MKRFLSILLALALLSAVPLIATRADAKTLQSAKGENIFFYAARADGKPVLLKILSLDELKAISHGQANGTNYYVSSTDNYPTTQYCEARGVTVPELVEYVGRVSDVRGADKIRFEGGDTIKLMATDSYGNYNRSWTYDELYGKPRYYFEGLFDSWQTAWELGGEDNSKFGLSLEEYNAKYRESDPYYDIKREVFSGGTSTVPILATESFSGRTTTDALVASTEIGIAEHIAKNNGIAAGSLRDVLTDETALRLALPMTEADLMAAHRTAFDNFKWIYNIMLQGSSASVPIEPAGAVEVPVVTAEVSGDTLTFAVSCGTEGARVFYSFDGAPQLPYSEPIAVDISGRDIAKSPVALYITAVREGYSDAGIITTRYPGLAPAFKTLYSASADAALTFERHDSVSAADWQAWRDAIQFVTMKAPDSGGYVRLADGDYIVGDDGVSFDAGLLCDAGSYSFSFHARGFADKVVSVTLKNPAPPVRAVLTLGELAKFEFTDPDYKNGLTLYITAPDGTTLMLSGARIDSYPVEMDGEYLLKFVNNRYDPSTVELTMRTDAVELLFFGDIQVTQNAETDFAAWEALAAAAAAANPLAALALQAGDIVESGIDDLQWDAFFDAKENALGAMPFYPTVGNHESNTLSGKPVKFLERFDLPMNGPDGFKEEFYSIEPGDMHITVLNSWIFSGEQKLTDADFDRINAWLRDDLSGTSARWKIVLTHLPVYEVHSDVNADAMQTRWLPLFEDCGVTIALVGHQHVYSRLAPQNGITQVMGNSGLKFYDSADETLAERTIYNISTYQSLTTDGNKMTISCFDIDGTLLDSVTLRLMTRGDFADAYPALGAYMRGYDGGDMGLDDLITREQIVTLLWRQAKGESADNSAATGDFPGVSQWAFDAWSWAVQHGIAGDTESPSEYVTRDGCAKYVK
ncbi:MAG: metallophosphoesterase [Oscillospiraceae bacterium]|jgi:hypothetical protein|nr:metallophosphoesterase [Oscillospiraceae bacterium]